MESYKVREKGKVSSGQVKPLFKAPNGEGILCLLLNHPRGKMGPLFCVAKGVFGSKKGKGGEGF